MVLHKSNFLHFTFVRKYYTIFKPYLYIFFLCFGSFNNITSSPQPPSKWSKWHDMWPSMVTHTRNLCSAFNPSKVHTHSSEHTHTRSSGQPFMLQRPGNSRGFSALLKGPSVVVLKVGESAVHSLLQFLPDLRLEPATFGLRVWLSNH